MAGKGRGPAAGHEFDVGAAGARAEGRWAAALRCAAHGEGEGDGGAGKVRSGDCRLSHSWETLVRSHMDDGVPPNRQPGRGARLRAHCKDIRNNGLEAMSRCHPEATELPAVGAAGVPVGCCPTVAILAIAE